MSAEGGLGGDQVEGRHAVAELLAHGTRRVSELLAVPGPGTDELVALARDRGVRVRRLDAASFARLARTEVPQGVIAKAAPISPTPLEALARPGPGGAPPFLVVLDQVTDPHNLGAILRSAVGAGATGVVLGRHRGAHLSPAACKAAAGAVEHVRFALVAGVPAALRDLARLKVWTVGLEAGAAVDLEAVNVLDAAVALVFGAEGAGLSPLVRSRCEVLCQIPLVGPLESLNVAAAAAIACFTVARKRA
ncbi:MAG: RNA methyltransferase [Actinomycetota bacterium]|nr:RNA methyltransferase [Actinomycetota bacterium]